MQADILAGALLSLPGSMRLWLTALMVTIGGFARGQQEICASCEDPIRTKIYMAESPYHKERKPVCAECAKDPN
jgi:hypothetical protein